MSINVQFLLNLIQVYNHFGGCSLYCCWTELNHTERCYSYLAHLYWYKCLNICIGWHWIYEERMLWSHLCFSEIHVEIKSTLTYLACILYESSGLFLDAWHVWVRGVDQSGDLRGPNEAVLSHWPAQVQSWRSQVRLQRPVGVRGTLHLMTSTVVCQLWDAGSLGWCLDCGLYKFNFWLCQEADHICSLEELIVALVWQEKHPSSLHFKNQCMHHLSLYKNTRRKLQSYLYIIFY